MTKVRCTTCKESKERCLFPKGATTYCLACIRLDSASRRGVQRWAHGVQGYKTHNCRCPICRAAMAAVSRANYLARKAQLPDAPPTLTSWWTAAPQVGFTKHVEETHLSRMHASTLGKGRGRAISSEELSR